MADYQAMYRQLFAAQTEAIEILQRAQQQTEEMYIGSPDPDVVMLDTTISKKSEETPIPKKQEGKT